MWVSPEYLSESFVDPCCVLSEFEYITTESPRDHQGLLPFVGRVTSGTQQQWHYSTRGDQHPHPLVLKASLNTRVCSSFFLFGPIAGLMRCVYIIIHLRLSARCRASVAWNLPFARIPVPISIYPYISISIRSHRPHSCCMHRAAHIAHDA